MNLLPYPRSLVRQAGVFNLPAHSALHLDTGLAEDNVLLEVADPLQITALEQGVYLELITGPSQHPKLAICAFQSDSAPTKSGGYTLVIKQGEVSVGYHDLAGLRAGFATLRQLLREYGRALPCLKIRDHPDFAKRGLMLDVSRGRVPSLKTLLKLVAQLESFKLNEFQLYTEHTFAYRNYEPVWKDWGALRGEDILILDAHCRKLGIELVPNQNSFGHLRYWLAYHPLQKLAETPKPWPDQGGAFLRHPATLAPTHPGTLPFLRGLYDELLPNFTSKRFNVGCDETWDLGRGQSKEVCERKGKGRVYLDFLKEIHREVKSRGKQMLFWGDIILHYPDLVKELPKDVVALTWGYDAKHPFDKEGEILAESKIPYYVCPGTSTWMTLIGRNDNAIPNLRNAALAGRKHGAIGYLNTDWGDGGHLHPLAVGWPAYIAGAAASWCDESFDESMLAPVLSREIFHDPSGRSGKASLALGVAHKKLNYEAPNITPLGTVIAAPPPRLRELFCRDGLKYFARIPGKKIAATLAEIEKQRMALQLAKPGSDEGKLLLQELDLAARMAAESCEFILWQQDVENGSMSSARSRAKKGIRLLRRIKLDFDQYWPKRNLGRPAAHWPFIKWRIKDYQRGTLPIPFKIAKIEKRSTSAD